MIKSGVKYKFIHDRNGSVSKVINSSNGSVASSLTYDEFGNITASVTPDFQPFGFAGGLRDSITNLIRFGARDYDPMTGRWLSKDPILFKGGDTNLYGYIVQDPVNKVDPTGLVTTCIRLPPSGASVCFSDNGPTSSGILPPNTSGCGYFLCNFPDDNPPLQPPQIIPPTANTPVASMLPPIIPSGGDDGSAGGKGNRNGGGVCSN